MIELTSYTVSFDGETTGLMIGRPVRIEKMFENKTQFSEFKEALKSVIKSEYPKASSIFIDFTFKEQ